MVLVVPYQRSPNLRAFLKFWLTTKMFAQSLKTVFGINVKPSIGGIVNRLTELIRRESFLIFVLETESTLAARGQ